MTENPYQSPRIVEELTNDSAAIDRKRALARLRTALVILSVPAFYNYMCFNFGPQTFVVPRMPDAFRFLNFVGLALILNFVWFFGLLLLELVTRACHAVFSRKDQLSEWITALYETCGKLIPFAIAGATLWTIWVFAFYQAGVGFYKISYPIAILAHLLAAGLYIPLIYRWFTISRRTTSGN